MVSAQRINFESTEFQPKNEYVLVKPQELETGEKKSDSGFIIEVKQNQSSLNRPTTGTVVSGGSDIDDISEDMLIIWPETDGLSL